MLRIFCCAINSIRLNLTFFAKINYANIRELLINYDCTDHAIKTGLRLKLEKLIYLIKITFCFIHKLCVGFINCDFKITG